MLYAFKCVYICMYLCLYLFIDVPTQYDASIWFFDVYSESDALFMLIIDYR